MKEDFKETPFQSIKATCNSTGFSQYFIRQGVKNGTIPHVRCGNKILINVPLFIQRMNDQSNQKEAV